MAELFRHMPNLLTPVTTLYNMIMNAGRIPQAMPQLYLVFLGRPKKSPELCASKLPITLISILAKALEAIILNRLLAQLEPKLPQIQFAYRRERSTEHRLLDFTDFI